MIQTETEYHAAIDEVQSLNARLQAILLRDDVDLLTVLNIHKALSKCHADIHRYLVGQVASSEIASTKESSDSERSN